MIPRISQRSLFRNINTNLGFLSWDMATLTNQLSSGRKVNKPSDDASGSATILAMRTILMDVEQYNKSTAVSDDWLKQTESVLLNMKSTVQEAYKLAEQLSTDTYGRENRLIGAEEVNKLFESLIKMGNTRIGDRYIFSGQRSEHPAFAQELTILDALFGNNNAPVFTGKVATQGDRLFNYRPDVAPQTQNFVIEITSAGGVDTGTSGYSLSRATIDPPGDHNGLFFTAKDGGPWVGSNGNTINIVYTSAGGLASANATVSGSTITVELGVTGSAITSTAQDIINAINANTSAAGMVDVSLAPGNSGLGIVRPVSSQTLSFGYDTPAMYRVSQDGGKTWSVPNAFTARDFRGEQRIYNTELGHSSYTTEFPGFGNDIFIVADTLGSFGNDIHVQFVTTPGSAVSVDFDPPGTSASSNGWTLTVHLETSASLGGQVVTTANEVINAINGHASASNILTAGLADYSEGGNGYVTAMARVPLSGGDNDYTALGHASYVTTLDFIPPDSNPNIEFTAVQHGDSGNNLQVEYVLGSAGVDTYVVMPPSSANVLTIRLETDASGNSVAIAPDIVDAVMQAYIDNPSSAMATAQLVDWPFEGGQPVGPLQRVSFTGGDDALHEHNHSINLRFDNDGSALQVGDRFTVDVGYYLGDKEKIDVNVDQGTRVTANTNGDDVLGENGAADNVLDILSRLEWALRQNDPVEVAEELPNLSNALEKITTQMSQVGVRMIRNQFVYNTLSTKEVSSTERLSRFEDLDYEDAITKLQTTQTAYQATLASTAMITKLSLVDYIS